MKPEDFKTLSSLMIGAAIAIAALVFQRTEGKHDARMQFLTGEAQVVTYTLPGQGECKAVMVNGERRAEKCEGEE